MDNQETKSALDIARAEIQIQNRWRDTHMSWNLPGFKSSVLAKVAKPNQPAQKKPFLFSIPCYLLFSIMLLNSLYRFIFNRTTDEQEYSFVKEISVIPFPSTVIVYDPAMYFNSAYACGNFAQSQTNFQREYEQNQTEYMPPQQVTQPYVK